MNTNKNVHEMRADEINNKINNQLTLINYQNSEQQNFMNTVEENKKLYTKRQIAGAEAARKLYQVVGYPSLKDFMHIIQTHGINNCPITLEDVKISQKIFGPDVYAIKAKTVRKKPKVVVNDYVEIPKELIQAHKGIELCTDIMFIDEVAFLVTMSKYIKFITIR